MSANPNSERNPPEGKLLIWLSLGFYAFFTLVPDSHSLMVKWPWVAFWQIGLLCPLIWLLWRLGQGRKLKLLDKHLDWLISVGLLGIIVSTVFAQFPYQSFWYGWAAFCLIAALYALNDWLTNSGRCYQLLLVQGYLSLAFILLSLFLWTTQTLLPELNRLHSLKEAYGVELPFDFSVLELRNWAPLGHQNYVAGYLVLAIPLLFSLCILQKGWQRWLWAIALFLGLINLYTTSSRGGWLGLFTICLFGLLVLLWRSALPRIWLGLAGLSTLTVLILLVLANNRLRSLITAVLQGKGGGELAYRLINAFIGWQMGISHPFSGIGLGGVPLWYQHYRPFWAGRESELIYQLHSTPVQLWAELGLWGIVPLFLGFVVLAYQISKQAAKSHQHQVFLWSLSASLLGYGVMSLTDYQLDNLSISGTIVIYIACLLSILRQEDKTLAIAGDRLCYSGIGLVIVALIWLMPIHRAWQLSSQGFIALSQKQNEQFVEYLKRAQQLAPWEPYYPLQLGWNLGDLALETKNAEYLTQAISAFERGNAISPYQEFGYSNLGWLLLQSNRQKATTAFVRASKLIPSKRGGMYALGLSLLVNNRLDLAVKAITLECLRDPLFITSPLWRVPQFAPVYSEVQQELSARYTELLKNHNQPSVFNAYLHRSRGMLFWWQGNLPQARADFEKAGLSITQTLLALAEGQSPESVLTKLSPSSAIGLLLKAWTAGSDRTFLLQKAWATAKGSSLAPQVQTDLLKTMQESENFIEWLKTKAPAWSYRRERSGFGVISRHIDGPPPLDFYPVIENLVISTWFVDLFASPEYFPDLDLAIRPWYESLWEQISEDLNF